jgi:hypothetical protein
MPRRPEDPTLVGIVIAFDAAAEALKEQAEEEERLLLKQQAKEQVRFAKQQQQQQRLADDTSKTSSKTSKTSKTSKSSKSSAGESAVSLPVPEKIGAACSIMNTTNPKSSKKSKKERNEKQSAKQPRKTKKKQAEKEAVQEQQPQSASEEEEEEEACVVPLADELSPVAEDGCKDTVAATTMEADLSTQPQPQPQQPPHHEEESAVVFTRSQRKQRRRAVRKIQRAVRGSPLLLPRTQSEDSPSVEEEDEERNEEGVAPVVGQVTDATDADTTAAAFDADSRYSEVEALQMDGMWNEEEEERSFHLDEQAGAVDALLAEHDLAAEQPQQPSSFRRQQRQLSRADRPAPSSKQPSAETTKVAATRVQRTFRLSRLRRVLQQPIQSAARVWENFFVYSVLHSRSGRPTQRPLLLSQATSTSPPVSATLLSPVSSPQKSKGLYVTKDPPFAAVSMPPRSPTSSTFCDQDPDLEEVIPHQQALRLTKRRLALLPPSLSVVSFLEEDEEEEEDLWRSCPQLLGAMDTVNEPPMSVVASLSPKPAARRTKRHGKKSKSRARLHASSARLESV